MFRKRITTVGRLWFVSVVILSTALASAQEFATEPDRELVSLDDKISQFLTDVAMGETPAAFTALLEGSQLAEQENALAALVEKTKELETSYGKHVASEQIAAKRVGKDLVLLKYLYKCERFPVVWHFVYYRTSNETVPDSSTWRVISVRFDTDLERLWSGRESSRS
ncbi:MAG TPA: hypothetical protein VE890_05530 [Thermoguttaceae bacterium]|nr:hypothetical protein [Thermoguttaceae bacterium]